MEFFCEEDFESEFWDEEEDDEEEEEEEDHFITVDEWLEKNPQKSTKNVICNNTKIINNKTNDFRVNSVSRVGDEDFDRRNGDIDLHFDPFHYQNGHENDINHDLNYDGVINYSDNDLNFVYKGPQHCESMRWSSINYSDENANNIHNKSPAISTIIGRHSMTCTLIPLCSSSIPSNSADVNNKLSCFFVLGGADSFAKSFSSSLLFDPSPRSISQVHLGNRVDTGPLGLVHHTTSFDPLSFSLIVIGGIDGKGNRLSRVQRISISSDDSSPSSNPSQSSSFSSSSSLRFHWGERHKANIFSEELRNASQTYYSGYWWKVKKPSQSGPHSSVEPLPWCGCPEDEGVFFSKSLKSQGGFYKDHFGPMFVENPDQEQFPPTSNHSSTLVRSTIWVFGGSTGLKGERVSSLWALQLSYKKNTNRFFTTPTSFYSSVSPVWFKRSAPISYWENVTSSFLHASIESPSPRSDHTGKSMIWFIGGKDQRGIPIDEAWVLDLSRREWQRKKLVGTLPPIAGHTSCLTGTNLLIYGGQTTTRSRHRSHSSSSLITLANFLTIDIRSLTVFELSLDGIPSPPRFFHSSVIVADEMHIWGGLDSNGSEVRVHSIIEGIQSLSRPGFKAIATFESSLAQDLLLLLINAQPSHVQHELQIQNIIPSTSDSLDASSPTLSSSSPSSSFYDVTFHFENDPLIEIRAHRAIISARCPTLFHSFLDIIDNNSDSSSIRSEVVLPCPISSTSFFALLRYLYSDQVQLSSGLPILLSELAERFDLVDSLGVICRAVPWLKNNPLALEEDGNEIEPIPPSRFLADMGKLLTPTTDSDSLQMYDVIFEVEGERFPTHRFLLSARAAYFQRMLNRGDAEESPSCTEPSATFQEANSKMITLSGVDRETFRDLLRFIVTDVLPPPSPENIQAHYNLLCVGHMYSIPSLIHRTQIFLLQNALDETNSPLLFETAVLLSGTSSTQQHSQNLDKKNSSSCPDDDLHLLREGSLQFLLSQYRKTRSTSIFQQLSREPLELLKNCLNPSELSSLSHQLGKDDPDNEASTGFLPSYTCAKCKLPFQFKNNSDWDFPPFPKQRISQMHLESEFKSILCPDQIGHHSQLILKGRSLDHPLLFRPPFSSRTKKISQHNVALTAIHYLQCGTLLDEKCRPQVLK